VVAVTPPPGRLAPGTIDQTRDSGASVAPLMTERIG